MSRRTATAAAVLAALLTLTTACGNDDPAPTPAPTPTATTSKPATPKDQAISDATKALDRYYDVTNSLRLDKSQPISKLDRVAIGFGLSNTQAEMAGYRKEKGVTESGNATFTVIKILNVSLDNSNPKIGRVPSVMIEVCNDVSDVKAVDSTGKSLINPDRKDRSIATFNVANYAYKKNPQNGWKVVSFDRKMQKSC